MIKIVKNMMNNMEVKTYLKMKMKMILTTKTMMMRVMIPTIKSTRTTTMRTTIPTIRIVKKIDKKVTKKDHTIDCMIMQSIVRFSKKMCVYFVSLYWFF